MPDDDPIEEFAAFSRGIPMLAPGGSISIKFGSALALLGPPEEAGVQLRYEATVRYASLDGTSQYKGPPLILDLLPYKHSLMERDDLHSIAVQLGSIRKILASWTVDPRLRINSIAQREIGERDQQLIEDGQADASDQLLSQRLRDLWLRFQGR